MQLQEYGYNYLKLFPAEAIDGRLLLQSLAAPLPSIQFCPTGGINFALAVNYLTLNKVFCVGGSWLTPAKLLKESARDQIEKLAREANQLKKSPDPSNI